MQMLHVLNVEAVYNLLVKSHHNGMLFNGQNI